MNGIKTILTMIVAAFIVPILAKQGVSLTPDQQAQAVAFGIAGIGIAMRFVSTGPAFADFRAMWAKYSAKTGLSSLTQDEVQTLTNLVIQELKTRQAAKAKETK